MASKSKDYEMVTSLMSMDSIGNLLMTHNRVWMIPEFYEDIKVWLKKRLRGTGLVLTHMPAREKFGPHGPKGFLLVYVKTHRGAYERRLPISQRIDKFTYPLRVATEIIARDHDEDMKHDPESLDIRKFLK